MSRRQERWILYRLASDRATVHQLEAQLGFDSGDRVEITGVAGSETALQAREGYEYRALAAASFDYEALRLQPTEEVVATLVAVPGIGRWTAEIYAMFALGRADVFAPGDLALQEAARILFRLEKRPSDKVLRAMAEDWSPWRSVAARILWAYYRVAKEREGII